MLWAAAIAATLVGGLLALLAVPVHVAFSAHGLDDLQAWVRLHWLFGLVRLERAAGPDTRAHSPEPSAPGRRKLTRLVRWVNATRDPGARNGRWFALWRQAAFRRRVWRLLTDLAAAAHPHGVRLSLRLGLGDPADTGRLWAVLGPVSALARQWRHAQVRLEPVFVDAACDFDAAGRLRLVPLRWLALMVAFVLSPAAIRAWWLLGRADG